jgi:Histidine kinase-, DNA gyrase B-, and HSP90-like ATPase
VTIRVKVGTESIRNYKRLAYQTWYALAELVDNSTQSYFNNAEELDRVFAREDTKLTVRVVYDRDQQLIRITDNAMGMSLEELDNALQIARIPAITSGRSEFGMGLKTAACWLGEIWTVRTKRLGEENEYTITFDVEKVASGESDLEPVPIPKDVNSHYTVIEIREMHFRLYGRTIGRTKDHLRSMYRVDVRDGTLDLFWDQEPLVYDESIDILPQKDGAPYRKDFQFDIDGRAVSGWVGILRRGGRPKAGFAIIRRGRVIVGQPSAWRPSEIFGQEQGRNDLINQRVVGEIHLDSFLVTHTKDNILWQGDEEAKMDAKLSEVAQDYIRRARQPHKGHVDTQGPSSLEIDSAVDEFRAELESQELVDMIQIGEIPPAEVTRATKRPVVDSVRDTEPQLAVSLGDANVKVYLSLDASPYDPYFVTDVATSEIIVIVNRAHPHWNQIQGSNGVLNYLRHCVYDAIAEWNCMKKGGVIQPDTIKMIKDQYLRLPMISAEPSDTDSSEVDDD